MPLDAASPVVAGVAGGTLATPGASSLKAEAVYEAHFDFVWRSLRRLGIPPTRLDDAVQDVFLVVHRRVGQFEQRSSLKTWLYGIVLRVVQDYRRSHRRKDKPVESARPLDPDSLADNGMPGPLERAEQRDSLRLLEQILSALSEEKREVFLLAELEQMTGPEIAEALQIETATAYSRLRAARIEFEQALVRHRARRGGTNANSE